MKGFRSTGIMFVMVGALAGYTFYEYKNAAEDAEVAKGDRRIFYLLRDQIKEIKITAPGTETQIERDGEAWKVTQPVSDQADSSSVEGFIFSLLTQKGKEFRSPEDKNVNWAEYGLDPVTKKIEIRDGSKTETLSVSSKNAFDGSYYIRVGNDVLLGDQGLAQLIERDPNSFRSRKIYRGPEDIQRAEVEYDEGGKPEKFVFVKASDKDKNVWSMEPKPNFPVDSEKITIWVQKVQGLVAGEFVTENITDQDRTQYLLKRPSMTIKMGETQMTFGQSRDADVFAFSDKRPTLYKVSATTLSSIRVPSFYFRDGKVPFTIPVEQAREIEIHTEKIKETLVKKDDKWQLKNPDKNRELNGEKLVGLLQKIKELEAREYLPLGHGFPKAPQLVVKGAQGEVLFDLAWGGEFKSKLEFNRGQNLRFVKVHGGREFYAVAKDKLDVLIDSDIIKKKEPNQTAAKSETR